MKVDGWRDEGFSPAGILGIIFLVMGLLIAVEQFFFGGNEVSNLDQVGLLARTNKTNGEMRRYYSNS